MEPFLKIVAHKMWEVYRNDIRNILFVFPNRRSGLFFQKYLSQTIDEITFSPQITTIYNFVEDLSGIRIVERLKLLFCLYNDYIEVSQTNQSQLSFDDFFKWGDILINDFDDIDKSMVDAKQILCNVADLKEIENDLNYLNEEQIEIIKRFWKNFKENSENSESGNFETIWSVLYNLYDKFTKELKSQGIGYSGLVFREVAENIKLKDLSSLPSKIIFIGLNALSAAEEKILTTLRDKKIAEFIWDYESPLLTNDENRASYFVNRNKKNFPTPINYNLNYGFQNQSGEKPKLNIVGISSNIGQAKYTFSILDDLSKNKKLNLAQMNSAIVLPNESLLLPTLYSIPEEIENINITMGYKLNKTTIVNLFNLIFSIQVKTFRNKQKEITFYHKDVINILKNKLVYSIVQKTADDIIDEIRKNNSFYIKSDVFKSNKFLEQIFKVYINWKDFSSNIKNILSNLYNNLMQVRSEDQNDLNVSNVSKNIFDLECDFIVEYYKAVNQVTQSLETLGAEIEVTTFISLLKKSISSVAIPFEGEPLGGLQIMGVLETRALDFENLIILSFNENIFPPKNKNNTLIPYALRKGFNLQTKEHHDSVFAYNFYRLISRTKNIYLIYDSRTDGALSGEVSRYYSQLKYLYSNYFDIKEQYMIYEVSTSTNEFKLEIEKKDNVLKKLEDFKKGGKKKLSASSLNSYINCPLQFYFQYVERLREEKEMEERVEAGTIGTIYHYLMEKLYEDYKNKVVTKEIIEKIKKNTSYIEKLLNEAFEKERQVITGYTNVIFEVLKKYVEQTLEHDSKIGNFKYLCSEYKIENWSYKTCKGLEINFSGFIDRIDELKGVCRIVDYKTGKERLDYKGMEELFDGRVMDRPKAILQTFLYALFYKQIENSDKDISPNIYLRSSFFDIKSNSETVNTKIKCNGGEIMFNEIEDNFIEGLDNCLEELFDPDVRFIQTENRDHCKYCLFTDICKR